MWPFSSLSERAQRQRVDKVVERLERLEAKDDERTMIDAERHQALTALVKRVTTRLDRAQKPLPPDDEPPSNGESVYGLRRRLGK